MMANFRKILRFFGMAIPLIISFYVTGSLSGSAESGKMLSLVLIASSWKVSYTNPPSLSIIHPIILAQNSSVQDDRADGLQGNDTEIIPKYGNHVNLNASSPATSPESLRLEKNPEIRDNSGNRTGRRIRGSKKSTSSRSFFQTYKQSPRRWKKDRLGNLDILDENSEAGSLRKKILSHLGNVDSLLCLPKALCGVSSRQKQAHLTASSSSLGSGEDPIVRNEDVENYLQLMQAIIPLEEGNKSVKKTRTKKMGSQAGSSKIKSESDSSEEMSKESEESQDDVDYFREKAEMEKYMTEDAFAESPNWWETIQVPNSGPNTIHPYQHFSDPSGSSSGGMWDTMPLIATGVSRLVRSMMPSMSWGFRKSMDVFGDDPFFKDNARSLSSRSSRWSLGTKSGGGPGAIRSDRRYRVKKVNKLMKRKQFLDQRKGEIENVDNPTEKFELAVEIGKQLEDPKQCDYIFNGCPFSYDEILAIIDDTSKGNNKIVKNPTVPEVPEVSEVSNDVEYLSSDVKSEISSQNEMEGLPITRTPSSRGKKRVIKHKMPNGEQLEIRLKVSDSPYSSNGMLTVPKISVIPNPDNSADNNLPSKPSPQFQDDELDLDQDNPYLRTDLPEQDPTQDPGTQPDPAPKKSEPEISSEFQPEPPAVKNRNKKVQINKSRPTRKPKVPKKKKKQWGKQNVRLPLMSNPIVPYAFNQPQPPPHVTNYHYYSANGPNTRYSYKPPPPPVSKPQADEPQEPYRRPYRYSHQPEVNAPRPLKPIRYPPPNSQSEEYNYDSPPEKYTGNSQYNYNKNGYQQKQKEQQQEQQTTPKPFSSEERIIIRLPESSNNNNYYNVLPSSPFSSTYPYQQSSQPPPLPPPNYLSHRPHQPYMPSMYPYSPSAGPGPGPYPYPAYPPPSMFSYLFGKK